MIKFLCLAFILLLSACSNTPIIQENYSTSQQETLYQLNHWTFSGRIAINQGKESWQANIHWTHQLNSESIKLSGPLGQGAILIELADNKVRINRGNKTEESNDINAFIKQQLGVMIPVNSLRYWVLGLPEKNLPVHKSDKGFYQANWLVEYPEMQTVENNTLPRKISVLNAQQIKLKLIIDEWKLHDF